MNVQEAALSAYLKQVEMYLPPWNAEEILREIRSHVLDQAEGIAAERGVEVDEAILQEALARLGAPQALAAGYVPAVNLMRPEYTLPFAIYSIVAAVLLIPLVFSGGPGLWLLGAIVAVGMLFVGFVVLSRFRKIYRLPIWHSKLGRVVWKVDLGQGLRRGVHAVWSQPALAGLSPFVEVEAGTRRAPDAGQDWALRSVSIESAGGVSGATGMSAPPYVPPVPRRTPMEWLIAHSGPRNLRIHELFGAGTRAVFGFALALFFAFAPSPFPILDLHFDDVREGWKLLIQGPGLEAFRVLGAIACMATCASGLIPIFLGKCRLSLYASIAAKIAWAVLLYSLAVAGPLFLIRFETVGWVENDWPQVHSAIQSGIPVALGIALFMTLLALVGSLVRLGMMMAWYRTQPHTEG